MKRLSLSNNGPAVSQLAYGVWRLAEDAEGVSPKRIRAKIDACLEAGITTFDHADIYGGYICEGLFGKVLKQEPALRSKMEIVTKCGINAPGPNRPAVAVKYYDVTCQAMETCVERSLKELSTDYIDVLLLHRPDWLTRADDTAEGLNRLIKSGKVRHAGVSNYSTDQFELLSRFVDQPLVTNQVEVSVLQTKAIYNGTLNQCERMGVLPMAWSPLAGGRLFASSDAAAARVIACMEMIAAKYNASIDQLALAWVLALPSRPIGILGTNSVDRILSAAKATEISLERQDWYALWTAAAGVDVP